LKKHWPEETRLLYATDRWYLRWLEPLGGVYRGVARARRRAYEEGTRPSRKLPRPVISIGNLTVGGTGKTPLVIYLCEKLAGWCHPAILTRGYGRKSKRDYMAVPSPKLLDSRAALFFGDEPVMMARRLKNTSIHIGPNRYKNGLKALDRDPVDVFLLDDGFQHVELARDLDIVIVDGGEDVRTLQTLPAGPLREPVESISRADIVVINHCKADGSHKIDMNWLRSQCPDVPIVLSRYEIKGMINAGTNEVADSKNFKKRKLFAFCGIARPQHFYSTLMEQGLNVVGSKSFNDHHIFTGRELSDLSDQAAALGADGLISTEKDVARLDTDKLGPLPLFFPRLDLIVLDGEENMWERIGEVLNVG
jgi:tetraacyldisaccharide 4'-kinase